MNRNLYHVFSSERICSSYNTAEVCENIDSDYTANCTTKDVELIVDSDDYEDDEDFEYSLYERTILVCEEDGYPRMCVSAGQLPGSLIKFEYSSNSDKCYDPYV